MCPIIANKAKRTKLKFIIDPLSVAEVVLLLFPVPGGCTVGEHVYPHDLSAIQSTHPVLGEANFYPYGHLVHETPSATAPYKFFAASFTQLSLLQALLASKYHPLLHLVQVLTSLSPTVQTAHPDGQAKHNFYSFDYPELPYPAEHPFVEHPFSVVQVSQFGAHFLQTPLKANQPALQAVQVFVAPEQLVQFASSQAVHLLLA